jgi:K(+)-stimulated pyrophosphate-energized sodium pump
VAVGFGLGIGALAGFLAGAIGTGCLMAVFLANSGGSWDNAKKIVEDGQFGGKGSDAHAATVIGDTVGDPFKDTAGPAINPLIKVMNLVSVLVAPAIVTLTVGKSENGVLRYGIAAIAAVIVVAAVAVSKTRDLAIGGDSDDESATPLDASAPDSDAVTEPGEVGGEPTSTLGEVRAEHVADESAEAPAKR